MNKIILAIVILLLLNVVMGHGDHYNHRDSYQRDHYNHNGRRHHNHHRSGNEASESSEGYVKSDSDFINWYNRQSNPPSQSYDYSTNSPYDDPSPTPTQTEYYDWSSGWYYPSSSSLSSLSSSYEIEYVSTGVAFIIVFSLVSLLFIITTFSCNGNNKIKREYVQVTQL